MNSVRDEDLHAYVDGQLDAHQRRNVEAYLSTRADKAAAVDDYRRQRIVLHRLFDRIEDRGIPQNLQALASEADRALRVGRFVRRGTHAAALCIGFALISLVTVSGTNPGPTQVADPFRDFRRQAIQAHLSVGDIQLAPDPAVEGAVLSVPELESIGLMPIGRRLISADTGDAVQIIYVDGDNSRVTLYVKSVGGVPGNAATFTAADGVGQVFWRDAGVAFSLLGPSDEETLTRIAAAIGHVGAAIFGPHDLPVDSAATAVQVELDPVVDGPVEESETLPAAPAPDVSNEEVPEEALPATQSRRMRQVVVVST